MNEQLEQLLAADEEGRARLDGERSAARAALDSVKQRLQREREERQRKVAEDLEREVEAIREDGAQEVARRRQHRLAYREERRRGGQRALDRAVDTFVRILRDGPPEGTA